MAVFEVSRYIMQAQLDNVQTRLESNLHTASDPEDIFKQVNPGDRL